MWKLACLSVMQQGLIVNFFGSLYPRPLHKKAVSSSIAIHVFLAQASALQALPCRWLTGNNVSSPLLKSSAKPGSSSAN